MNNLKKIDDILGVTVKIATAIVTLAGIWKEIGPDVKKALKPVIEACKKIASNEQTNKVLITEKQ